MIQLGLRKQLKNDAGDPVRNKAGRLAYDRGERIGMIERDSILIVRVESATLLEKVRSQFERLTNAIGVRLDIGVAGDALSTEHDPDPEEPVLKVEDSAPIVYKMARVDPDDRAKRLLADFQAYAERRASYSIDERERAEASFYDAAAHFGVELPVLPKLPEQSVPVDATNATAATVAAGEATAKPE